MATQSPMSQSRWRTVSQKTALTHAAKERGAEYQPLDSPLSSWMPDLGGKCAAGQQCAVSMLYRETSEPCRVSQATQSLYVPS
jgi:hypothetical protein